MGGQGSDSYVRFRTYACEAYNILRKSADLILSLFHLMAGASIEAIRQDPEKAILKLQVSQGMEDGWALGGFTQARDNGTSTMTNLKKAVQL